MCKFRFICHKRLFFNDKYRFRARLKQDLNKIRSTIMIRDSRFKRTSDFFYSHYKRLRKSFRDILTSRYRRCWRYSISHKWQFIKKTYSRHHQDLCDVQIRFKVCDSIRFERSRLITSFGFCDPFFT